MMTKKKYLLGTALLFVVGMASASGRQSYEVSITNLTPGQTFTPQLVVTHSSEIQLFRLGEPASTELAILAEDGATGPLGDVLGASGRAVGQVTTIPGLLGPGKTAVVRVEASPRHNLISAAGMLIPTNDTFFAVNGARLPLFGTVTMTVPAYDAGSEANDQNCLNIPGPRCGGAGSSPGVNPGDEGFVHIGNGFHDLPADPAGGEILTPRVYDWRNPVALITIRRIH